MNGIIVINKPEGYTSFDVVAIMRRLLNIKKIGHTGTLDPMASGVLPILIGRATKLQSLMPNTQKEYIAKFRLGVTTDTLDITGEILSEQNSNVSMDELSSVLKYFKGDIMQMPPMYSAVQKDGIRLYELARRGISVERKERTVCIHHLEMLNFNEGEQICEILVRCSKGTYIRTLCNDIGTKLGCGAVLTSLIRTKSNSFNLEDSITIDKAKELSEKNMLLSKILPADKLFSMYNRVKITKPQEIRFKNGGGLSINRIKVNSNNHDGDIYRVYNENDIFIGLGKINKIKGELSILCLLELS